MKKLVLSCGVLVFINPLISISISENNSTSKNHNPLNYYDLSLVSKQDSIEFDQQQIDEVQLYTGGLKKENRDTQTNGIYITKISSKEIDYSYTQLINWKKQFDKTGIAELISTTDSIDTVKSKELAYKFIDSKNDFVIYVTKRVRINETRCILFNNNGEQISALMYNK